MSNSSEGLFFKYNIDKLHSLIKTKEINCHDIVKECINRSRKIDTKYHIWSFFDEKEITNQISENLLITDKEYDMSAIPVAIKDIFNTKTLPTYG